ncbi:ribulose-phosphate 3-epimerase [Olsenella sp. YH-ols2217]|uniref:Ribulose-phosphate 3-epimerase n=1 Tax=Kribbibacterium absianum TaxID=3044210 RepID=A0ABT6ZIQ6_9ACTN|nr:MULTISPECIES: ribulose-phosphate 3-epimerase [unclassified Olsenella]MDJ1121445.1 ribulose-phosphate 3-epimerase [Olsenella sp. YH-ols2216]MDJ1128935.1 ribulose-phosphate 3-epimerase [Olsenella sp. YH-ols2217]
MRHRTVKVAPSILSADILRLGDELATIGTADLVHIDVMDGSFVPNLTFGPNVVRACKAASSIPTDVHLMIENPDEAVGLYLKAGADLVCFHWEAARHAHRIVSQIHEGGARAAVALNPGTPVGCLEAIIEELDMVLLMSVDPGFGGQRFIPSTIDKLQRLVDLCDRHGVSPWIEVDGGVSATNAAEVVAAGANVLVAGSAVFGAPDREAAITSIRKAGHLGLGRDV